MTGMGTRPTGTVERAYQLARSGMCGTIAHIEAQLVREHHSNVSAHLSGSALRKALRKMCREAAAPRSPTPAGPEGPDGGPHL
jgi:hypothetical protein